MRNVERLSRQIRLLTLLSSTPRGLSSRRLAGELGCGRATIDRDLRLLRERVGVRIHPARVNGEVWHRLDGMPLRLAVTPAQLAALAFARDALAPLAGTELGRELASLAPSAPPARARRVGGPRAKHDASVTAVLDAAIVSGHRVRIETRIASRGGSRQTYVVEPITFHIAGGESYLDAWSIERDAFRTYKIARILRAEALPERAAPHTDVDLEAVFANAVKTWSGELTRVRIRIAGEVAWIVPEYALVASQTITPQPDGSVIVEAEVAGMVEASRWTLGWGRNAQALEPSELRDLVLEELRGALAGYSGPLTIVSEVPRRTPTAPRHSGPRSRTTQVRGGETDA